MEDKFDAFLAKELPSANKSLAQKKLPPIEPLARKDWDAANSDSADAPAKLDPQTSWEHQ